MKKTIVALNLFVFAFWGMSATVDKILVRQQWPWSDTVEVDYVLSGVTGPVDIQVSFGNGETPIAADLTGGRVVGDRVAISTAGEKSFRFRPADVFGANASAVMKDLRVKLTPVPTVHPDAAEVLYRIYDLKAVTGEDAQDTYPVTDVTRADILNGKYGSYETEYAKIGPGFVTSLEDVLIWTGVTNDLAYKTDKLVLRRIPAAGKSFQMGSNTNGARKAEVSFAHDYWMAVFETTVHQHRLITQNPSYQPFETNRKEIVDGTVTVGDICAANYTAWTTYRTRKSAATDWPAGTHADVSAQCPIGQLQAKSGGRLFDLPTNAEWEFATRAGTTTALPSGKAWSGANMREIGRMPEINCLNESGKFPAADCTIDYGTGMVGQYRPNAYGLYDTMGNVLELCLDYYNAAEFPVGGTDPKGSTTYTADGTASASQGSRSMRGGSYRYRFSEAGFIGLAYATWNTKDFGYRICLHEVDK